MKVFIFALVLGVTSTAGNTNYGNLGNRYAGTTLHWGPSGAENRWGKTHKQYNTSSSDAFTDAFHTWTLDWTPNYINASLDGKSVFSVDPGKNFWTFGNFSEGTTNPWASSGKMALFDQPFYLIINLAVGGVTGYFPDGVNPAKPWLNNSTQAYLDFWKGKSSWLPTWLDDNEKISNNAALQVDSIRVFKLDGPKHQPLRSACTALCSHLDIIFIMLTIIAYEFTRKF